MFNRTGIQNDYKAEKNKGKEKMVGRWGPSGKEEKTGPHESCPLAWTLPVYSKRSELFAEERSGEEIRCSPAACGTVTIAAGTLLGSQKICATESGSASLLRSTSDARATLEQRQALLSWLPPRGSCESNGRAIRDAFESRDARMKWRYGVTVPVVDGYAYYRVIDRDQANFTMVETFRDTPGGWLSSVCYCWYLNMISLVKKI